MEDPKKKREREGLEAMTQYEADARAVREKTARLRELRLKHEALAASAASTPKSVGGKKRAPAKAKPGKTARKGEDLSAWLSSQQKEGRRS